MFDMCIIYIFKSNMYPFTKCQNVGGEKNVQNVDMWSWVVGERAQTKSMVQFIGIE